MSFENVNEDCFDVIVVVSVLVCSSLIVAILVLVVVISTGSSCDVVMAFLFVLFVCAVLLCVCFLAFWIVR